MTTSIRRSDTAVHIQTYGRSVMSGSGPLVVVVFALRLVDF